MKKLLLGLAAILSVSALAQDYHVYVGGGLDLLDNPFTLIKQDKKKDPKYKLTDDHNGKTTASDYVVRNGALAGMKDSKDFSLKKFNLKLEATKEIANNLEFGVGIKYINEKQKETSLSKKDFEESIDKALEHLKTVKTTSTPAENVLIEEVKTDLQDKIEDIKKLKDFHLTIKSHAYNSIPIYATIKYNLKNKSDFTPYIKADLGYSFNINLKKSEFNYKFDKGTEDPSQDLAGIEKKLKQQHKEFSLDQNNIKIHNGLYAAAFIGTEYKNFFAEIGGAYVDGFISFDKNRDFYIIMKTNDFKIMTNVGFKF